ncbi:MAG TPA: trypsin-like peptidase domain-containing protein [Ktedonobacterales bacterium]|nr:trypsin-like peptidase domain-containing protein [Ktedonobacterales bacterium]
MDYQSANDTASARPAEYRSADAWGATGESAVTVPFGFAAPSTRALPESASVMASAEAPTTPPVPATTPPAANDPTWSGWASYRGTVDSAPSGGGDGPTYVPPVGWQDPRPRRGPRLLYGIIAGALLLAVLLASTFAIGHLAGATSVTHTNTGGGTTTSTITLPPSAQDLQQAIITTVHNVEPAVVEVMSDGQGGSAIGSGVVMRADGYIVTNDHVVQGFSQFHVLLSDGTNLTATVVGQDAQDDLAVLKVNATNLHPIALADSSKVQVGEFALALGNPLGLNQSATLGIVSALNRTASEGSSGTGATLTGLVQTSAPINPGNSGGALVDLQGALIGIPTLGAANTQNGGSADGIGFAIPANRVAFVVTQLISSGHLTSTGQGFLGIRGQDVDAQVAAQSNLSTTSGVLVSGFANDAAGASPAQQAGIRSGDVIIAVNGTVVTNNSDLAGALLSQNPGTKVTVTVQRGTSQVKIDVTLGERPANG